MREFWSVRGRRADRPERPLSRRRGDAVEELVGPGNEVLPIRAVGVPAVMLTPGQLAIEQAHVDRRHLLVVIVVRGPQVFRAQEPEYRPGGDGGHVAALLVQPLRVALLRHAVADEGQARRAQGDQLMRIHGYVAGVLAAENGFRGAVLQEVAGHPMVFSRSGEVLHRFSPIAAVQFGAALAGGTDEHDREAGVERHRHEGGLAVARDTFNPDVLGVHGFVGFEIIQTARRRPTPRPAASPSRPACEAGPC